MKMIDDILDLFGYVSKTKSDRLVRETARKACELSFKEGYNEGFSDANMGFGHKFKPSKPRQVAIKPEVFVLFVKAIRGGSILDIIKNNNSLIGINPDSLVSNVLRVWWGTESQFDKELSAVYSLPAEVSTVGQEYDTVAIALPYPDDAQPITKNADSFQIGQVIRRACELGVNTKSISNRLSFNSIKTLNLVNLN